MLKQEAIHKHREILVVDSALILPLVCCCEARNLSTSFCAFALYLYLLVEKCPGCISAASDLRSEVLGATRSAVCISAVPASMNYGVPEPRA